MVFLSRNFSFTNSDQLTNDDWVIYDPSKKKGIQSIIRSLLALIFVSDIIILECNIFQPVGPWWTFLTENQQNIEIWENCPNFGTPKNRKFSEYLTEFCIF